MFLVNLVKEYFYILIIYFCRAVFEYISIFIHLISIFSRHFQKRNIFIQFIYIFCVVISHKLLFLYTLFEILPALQFISCCLKCIDTNDGDYIDLITFLYLNIVIFTPSHTGSLLYVQIPI